MNRWLAHAHSQVMFATAQIPLMSVPKTLERPAGDDAALLTRVAGGDRAAFSKLFQRYKRPLAAFSQRITGRPDLADDIVNETMLVVWRQATRFEARSKPSTWIFAIAYRTALSQIRRHRETGDGIALDDPEAAEVGYDTREALVEKDAARRALDVLSPEQRAVVELTHYFGYSTAEIATILSCPQGTVKTRMFAARRAMQTYLKSRS